MLDRLEAEEYGENFETSPGGDHSKAGLVTSAGQTTIVGVGGRGPIGGGFERMYSSKGSPSGSNRAVMAIEIDGLGADCWVVVVLGFVVKGGRGGGGGRGEVSEARETQGRGETCHLTRMGSPALTFTLEHVGMHVIRRGEKAPRLDRTSRGLVVFVVSLVLR